MSIASTAIGREEKKSGAGTDDLGAFSLDEFCALFKISRRTAYNEVAAGRLKLSKIRDRSVVTKTEARRYQAALDTAAGTAA